MKCAGLCGRHLGSWLEVWLSDTSVRLQIVIKEGDSTEVARCSKKRWVTLVEQRTEFLGIIMLQGIQSSKSDLTEVCLRVYGDCVNLCFLCHMHAWQFSVQVFQLICFCWQWCGTKWIGSFGTGWTWVPAPRSLAKDEAVEVLWLWFLLCRRGRWNLTLTESLALQHDTCLLANIKTCNPSLTVCYIN